MARPASKTQRWPAGFVAIPVHTQAVTFNGTPVTDVYRLAYETAQAQVQERRRAYCRAARWN